MGNHTPQIEVHHSTDIDNRKVVEQIEKISGNSFGPGRDLLDREKVIQARLHNGVLRGRVLDGTVHPVGAYLDIERTHDCICRGSKKACKHAVAVLLYATENLSDMADYAENGGYVADHLLEGISEEEAKYLLIPTQKYRSTPLTTLSEREAKYLLTLDISSAKKTFKNLISILGKNEIQARMRYADELNKAFVWMLDNHGFTQELALDFKSFLARAKRYEKKKNYYGAVCVYQGISEAIADNMELVDDSSGYYADMFQHAIKEMTRCIILEGQGHPRKRQYISYLHGMLIRYDPDYFDEFYDKALRAVCTTREDLEYLKELHDPLVPDYTPKSDGRKYRVSEMVKLQAYILGRLRDLSP